MALNMRVLIVDDEPKILNGLRRLLKDEFDVICAENGEAALQEIERAPLFDAIISDLNMPLMDGIELIRMLGQKKYAGKVILLSGSDTRVLSTSSALASAFGLNAIAALEKPVTKEALVKCLNSDRENVPKPEQMQEDLSVSELKSAIETSKIVLFFQPKIDIKTRKLVGVEALARYEQDDGSYVSPDRFITVAEENHLMNELSSLVYRKAIEQIGKWQNKNYDFTVSINLTMGDFVQPKLSYFLDEIAQASGVDTSKVILEITESKLMEEYITSLDNITRLRLNGFGLSIDDFGTGYSSMEKLKQIPFTELKVDRMFVHAASEDPIANAILESSVKLAKMLGMKIVAEGVEDESDWDHVEKLECDVVQGFYISKPLSVAQFDEWVEHYS